MPIAGIAYYRVPPLFDAGHAEVVPLGNDIMGGPLTVGTDSDAEPTVFVVKVRGDAGLHARIASEVAGSVFYGLTFAEAVAAAAADLGSVFASRMADAHFPDE